MNKHCDDYQFHTTTSKSIISQLKPNQFQFLQFSLFETVEVKRLNVNKELEKKLNKSKTHSCVVNSKYSIISSNVINIFFILYDIQC